MLSLFDGIGCGLEAFKRANISVSEYHAFEIDALAKWVANKNHPEIIQNGSVIGADFTKFANFDYLIGGSPCQGFSLLGQNLGFDDPRSKLYFEFERALAESKPKNFLLENVVMKSQFEMIITERLGVAPILINSALVSAQNRKRLYWTNFDCEEPEDRNINLQDILLRENVSQYKVNKTPSRDIMWLHGKCKDITESKKSNCLTTKQDRWGNAGLIKFEDYCRYLTPIECERLQTLPDDYTKSVSDTERYKMIGNCWTVEVIADLLRQSL